MINVVEETLYTGKFKEGDEVVVSGILLPSEIKHYGRKGVIRDVSHSSFTVDDFPYCVRFDGEESNKWFNEACLTAVAGNYDLEFMAINILKEWYGDGFDSHLSNTLMNVAWCAYHMDPKYAKLSSDATMVASMLEQRSWGVGRP